MPLEDVLTGLGLDRPASVAVPAGRSAYAPSDEPDDPSNSESFSVSNGVPLDVPLGFRARSAIIDNNTSAYMNLPDATTDGVGRWVGPGQPGAFPLLARTSRARVFWTAPPGKSQPAAVATEQAQITFLAAPLPPGQGSAVAAVSARAIALPLASRAIGTYNFDLPSQTGFKGYILYIFVTAGGTVTVSMRALDEDGNSSSDLLVSAALAPAPTLYLLRSYPGMTTVANQTSADVLGQTPRIVSVVAGAPATFRVSYDLVA